jgi:microcystin degradation protein MlrC
MKRVGIICLNHESNTFNPRPTTLEDFENGVLLRGQAVVERFTGGNHEVSGFIEALEEAKIEAAPILAAIATPSGIVSKEAFDALVEMVIEGLKQAGPLDGILAAPHGAGVSQEYPDMDGRWLSMVRKEVGGGTPIVCTLDPHGNLTELMVESTDAILAYRTNPHLDQKARGVEAGRLMARTIRGEVRPVQAASFPALAINIERQFTPEPPCSKALGLADEMLKRPGVLGNSFIMGFPYADVKEMGTSFVVITDHDRALARKCADELGEWVVQHREEFVGELISPADAIAKAVKTPGPVCLLDMGDNAGGGSPGDGTLLAMELDRLSGKRSFVALVDPKAQAKARAAGVGARIPISMGGRSDKLHGPTFRTDVTVRFLHDGVYTDPQPRHGGQTRYDMGPTAVVETDRGLTIQLTTHKAFPVSLQQLVCCKLDPGRFDIIVAKGVHAPLGAYAKVCKTLIRVNTPGITCADMTSLKYKHRRVPLFPFEK